MYIELESNGNRYKNSSLVGYLDETRTHLEDFIRDLKESTVHGKFICQDYLWISKK